MAASAAAAQLCGHSSPSAAVDVRDRRAWSGSGTVSVSFTEIHLFIKMGAIRRPLVVKQLQGAVGTVP